MKQVDSLLIIIPNGKSNSMKPKASATFFTRKTVEEYDYS